MNEDIKNEVENLEEQISKVVRLRGYYSIPTVRAYPPTVKILNKMVQDGYLVVSQHGRREIIYSATNKVLKTIVVRGVTVDKIQEGFIVGQKTSDEVVSKINARFSEIPRSDFELFGVVTGIETKFFPANFWEKVTFRKTVLKTVLKFHNHHDVIVEPTAELMKVR